MDADLSAYEFYLHERVNAHRLDAGLPPLAWSEPLADAARAQATRMSRTKVLEHAGDGDTTPVARMREAGYVFQGAWSGAENVASLEPTAEARRHEDVDLIDDRLIHSEKHVRNRLNVRFREMGAGLALGEAAEGGESLHAAETFARSGADAFLTGAVFVDEDGDDAYDPGEGVTGVVLTVSRRRGGAAAKAPVRRFGGYATPLPPGAYEVRAVAASGELLAAASVEIAGDNLKLDLVLDPPPPPETLGEARLTALKARFRLRTPRVPTAPSGPETAAP